MSAAWRAWKKKGAPRLLVQWLRSGVPLKWRGRAPVVQEIRREEQDEEIIKELQALVRDGAFRRGEAKVISPTFLIPKRDGTKRLIHDLREVNKSIAPPKFTLHGARDAGEVVRNSEWLAALDLRHGYQQVAMEPNASRYLGARMGQETIISTVLPFGLNLSPYVFTRLTGWLAREIRRRFGLQVAVYIDDFLLGAETREALEEGLRKVREFFAELGVVVSEKKEAKVANKVEFIGFTWDAKNKTVGVPEARRREYRRGVQNLIRHPQTRATWRRVIGRLGFLKEAVGPTMRHVRSLLHAAASRSGGKLIEAAGEALEDLQWWSEKLRGNVELSLRVEPVTASVTTDASDGGLGFIVNVGATGKEGERQDKQQIEQSLVTGEPDAHINKKEIEAVLRALQENREELKGRHLVWYSDSVTALAAVRRQGTQRLSPGAWAKTKEVLDLAEQEGIKILTRHVPGRLNGAADCLSRPGEERTAWEAALQKVTKEWGPLQEDPCGATREPTSLLEGLEWAARRTLLFPRVGDIGNTLRHLALCAGDRAPEGHPSLWERMAVVITPLWRGAVWWPALERMRVAFLELGRLGAGEMERWRQRNGHEPEWTASLVPLETRSGQAGQGKGTREPCSGLFDGRSREDSPQGRGRNKREVAREA